jgi:hypothetical protein
LVVQVVTSILQSSKHCCLSRLASDASQETAANSGEAATKMARARYPNFIDFLWFAPRIVPRGNKDGSALSRTPNRVMIARRYSRDVGSFARGAFANTIC